MPADRDDRSLETLILSADAFGALPRHLRTCAHLLYQEMRDNPDLERVPDQGLLGVICSEALRPLLETRAAHLRADLRVHGLQ